MPRHLWNTKLPPQINIYIINKNMEENQNIEPAAQVPEADPAEEVSTPSQAAAEQSEEIQQPEVKIHRKNGRNRSGRRGISSVSRQSASDSCGELENPAEFHEKLSGSNVSGYGDKTGNSPDFHRQKRERRERGDRRRDHQRSENTGEAAGESSPETEDSAADAGTGEVSALNNSSERRGPSFESRKFIPRAVEVELSDRRPKMAHIDEINDGVVSYSSEDNKCSISLFDRIRNIIKSIFGKKEDSKRRFTKKGGKKNWKGNRDNGKRSGGYVKNGKPGYGNRRRFNDRRPSGGKPRGGNADK